MRRPLFFVFAALVPLLLYARTATFGFVQADDADLIAGNQAFLSNLGNAPRAFARSYFEVDGELTAQKTYYRPLAIVSFMADAARAGADPRAYHLTNAVLHATVCCLLLALALAWNAAPRAALAAALLFAVHPANVQAVAWIAGRNDLLMAAFGLVSLICFAALKRCATTATMAAGRDSSTRAMAQRFSAAFGHTVAFAGALFSKETGVFFPVMAVLHQAAVAGAPPSRAQKAALGADAAVVALWAVLRSRALEGTPSDIASGTLAVVAANAPQFLVQIRKMLFPVALNVTPGPRDLDLLLAAAALVAFAFVARRLPRGLAAVAVAWVLAFLLPTLLVPGLPAYEHRVYVPLIGVVVAVAGAPALGRLKPPPAIAWGVVVALVAGLGAITWQRQEVFRDPFAFWTDASRDPRFGAVAHVNLGQLHEAAGRPAEARREYLRALATDPATPKAHNNLGVVLMQLEQPELAVTHFREETRLHPWNADAWFNLGVWAEMHGDAAAARTHYERAIKENPAYRPAYEKLGLPPPQSPRT